MVERDNVTDAEARATRALAVAAAAMVDEHDVISTLTELLRDPLAHEEQQGSGSWAGRAEVHQATGMVIAQMSLPPEDALAILKAHAYALDTTLADVAGRVLRRELDFGR